MMSRKKDDLTELSFEQALEKLRKHTQKLESDDLDLESALKGYEEAVRLASYCLDYLKDAEERVKKISMSKTGKLVLEDFDSVVDE